MKYHYYISIAYDLPEQIVSSVVTRKTHVLESGELWRTYPLDTYEKIQTEVKGDVLKAKPTAQQIVVLSCNLMRIEE